MSIRCGVSLFYVHMRDSETVLSRCCIQSVVADNHVHVHIEIAMPKLGEITEVVGIIQCGGWAADLSWHHMHNRKSNSDSDNQSSIHTFHV